MRHSGFLLAIFNTENDDFDCENLFWSFVNCLHAGILCRSFAIRTSFDRTFMFTDNSSSDKHLSSNGQLPTRNTYDPMLAANGNPSASISEQFASLNTGKDTSALQAAVPSIFSPTHHIEPAPESIATGKDISAPTNPSSMQQQTNHKETSANSKPGHQYARRTSSHTMNSINPSNGTVHSTLSGSLSGQHAQGIVQGNGTNTNKNVSNGSNGRCSTNHGQNPPASSTSFFAQRTQMSQNAEAQNRMKALHQYSTKFVIRFISR